MTVCAGCTRSIAKHDAYKCDKCKRTFCLSCLHTTAINKPSHCVTCRAELFRKQDFRG